MRTWTSYSISLQRKWEDDAIEEAREAVPGITQEEFDAYREEDVKLVAGIIELADRAAVDEKLREAIFDSDLNKAYEAAAPVAGEILQFEDFKELMEYGGKPFFKTFEGGTEDELSEEELEEAAGGISKSEWAKILRELAKHARGCFVAGSPVDTPSGSRAIQDIRPGDTVYSVDKDGNKTEARVKLTTTALEDVVEVYFENGKKWLTTSSQWFFDGNKFYDVWQHNGHDVVTLDGTTKIKNIEEAGRKEMVYDLIVEGKNIFFIDGQAAEGYGT